MEDNVREEKKGFDAWLGDLDCVTYSSPREELTCDNFLGHISLRGTFSTIF